MDAATAHRDDLVAEVDLALAALRRVIVKAIERPMPIVTPAIEPAPTRSDKTFKPHDVHAATGVEVNLVDFTIAFRNQIVTVSMRQAQLAAVLASASPEFLSNDDATKRAWPDLADSTRITSIQSAMRRLASSIDRLGLKAERIHGRGCRLFASESGEA